MSLTIEQFTAWVTVDDVEVPLYGIEYSADGKQATCWIASEAGKTFAVHWKDPECTFITSGYVSVDGLINPGLLIRPGLGPTTAKCYSTRTSATHRRPFMFSTLELTDDDNYLNRATSPELGNIQLQLEHVTITGTAGVDNGIAYKAPEKIHEKAKKAMGHRIQLGDEIAAPPGVTYSCSRVRQIGTFLFKYRPLEHLQANGIVPVDKGRKRAAPPEDILDLTLDNNDDVDDSQAQRTKNKAEKRMQHLEKELSTLKQKYGPNAKRVKVEVKSEPKAGPSFVDGEIIDLT